ncbi:winged helix-turn-helix domain-containing protein [Caldivirga sp.]|uniref:winged helix-turn-helix domain-containing protein n=1 Tax=Caldivirga sp. TaxID=2080243 RepID=UPI003D0C2121
MNLVDEIMESKVRIKVILALYELGELNITQLAKIIGSNYTLTLKHVKALERVGIVKEVTIGRMRIIKLNKDTPAYKHIRNLANTLKDLMNIQQ